MSDLVGNTDAQVWTREWLAIIDRHPGVPTDEGTMVGWFANAIESGRMAGSRELEVVRSAAVRLADAVEAYLTADTEKDLDLLGDAYAAFRAVSEGTDG